jgi:CHRD domain
MRAVVVVLGLFALSARGDEDDSNRFRARLVGGEETPAIFTPGSGKFSARVVDGDTRIEFTLSWFNLTSAPTVAHVHIGQRGVAGGVSYFLCGGGGKPACPASASATISGSVVAADVLGPVAQGIQPGDLAAVLTMTRRGLTYANVHTPAFPAGEIRGRVKARDHHHDDDDD